jgi:hypothetical protein
MRNLDQLPSADTNGSLPISTAELAGAGQLALTGTAEVEPLPPPAESER